MPSKVHITEDQVTKFNSKLPADGKNDEVHFDTKIAGFGIRLRSSGARTFVYYYQLGGKQWRYTIGALTETTAKKARAEAMDLAQDVRKGINPLQTKREREARTVDTFGNLVDKYLQAQKGQVRESTLAEIKRHLEKHCKPLHKSPLYLVDQGAITKQLDAIEKDSGPVAMNRVRANLSAMYAWAMRATLAKSNPVINTNKRKETPRDRVLTDDEIRAIWKAAGESPFGVIVKVLLLTAQRRNEIAALRWDELDFDKRIITLPTERTKNGDRHTIPMSDTVHDLLKAQERKDGRPFLFGYRDGPFSGFSKAKRELDKATGKMDGWTLHDLRRSAVTGMAELGIDVATIEAIVNHKSGHKAGVAGIYNHAKYAPRKAEALTRWADHVAAIVAGKKSNVTPLKKPA